MTDELTVDDVREDTAKRDESGELIPDTYDIEWNGETRELAVKPITGGLANRVAKHEEGFDDLDPQAVAAVLSAACPALEDIRAEDVRDMPLDQIQALVEPIGQQMPEVEPAEGNR